MATTLEISPNRLALAVKIWDKQEYEDEESNTD